MADKYQTLVSGRETMKEATVSSTGVAQAGQIVGLDSTGKLDVSILPVGVGPDVTIVVASEALAAGDYINLYSNSGTPTARKADASNDRPAHGFIRVSVLSAANATVYFEGPNDAKSGLTVGARYYLGAAGAATTTAPSLSGSVISQFLGIAINATTINTDIADEIVL